VRILLVDDEPEVRTVLRVGLGLHPGWESSVKPNRGVGN
jgi:hypothetical protein